MLFNGHMAVSAIGSNETNPVRIPARDGVILRSRDCPVCPPKKLNSILTSSYMDAQKIGLGQYSVILTCPQ